VLYAYLDQQLSQHACRQGRSPLTVKAVRGDLVGFATWWEARLSRPFDPALLRPNDLQTWRLSRQKDDAAAPATINRALVTLRAYCYWAKHAMFRSAISTWMVGQ
jgi:site-specific recombinase XerD